MVDEAQFYKVASPGKSFVIHIFPNSSDMHVYPKYTLTVVDTKRKKLLKEGTIAVFVIPQGKEFEWQYSTYEGMLDLVDSVRISRLIIVLLNHGFVFNCMEQVQSDLLERVQLYRQESWTTDVIPFVSDKDDIGTRGIIFQSGDKVVEEVLIDGVFMRQLIFLQAVGHIQSEVRLKRIREVPEYPTILAEEQDLPAFMPCFRVDIDYSFLTFEYQRAEVAGFSLIESFIQYEQSVEVLVLGTGAGVLSTFLHKHFPNLYITAVDIDSSVVNLGKGLFGLQEDYRLKSVVKDAKQFVEEFAGTETKYHAILLDISSPDPNEMVPPPDFRQDRFMLLIKDLLVPNGMLMVNTIAAGDKQFREFKDLLTRFFAIVYQVKCEEERNQIFITINNTEKYVPKTPMQLQTVIRNIEKTVRWDTTMNIQTLAGGIRLIHPYIPSVMPVKMVRKKRKRKL